MNNLHRSIPNSKIPAPLKQPLVFGNRRQIESLRDLEEDINRMETEQAKIAGGKLKYFDVTIEYSGEQNFRILAIDAEDAKEKAKEEANQNDADIEVDFINVKEVKR